MDLSESSARRTTNIEETKVHRLNVTKPFGTKYSLIIDSGFTFQYCHCNLVEMHRISDHVNVIISRVVHVACHK